VINCDGEEFYIDLLARPGGCMAEQVVLGTWFLLIDLLARPGGCAGDRAGRQAGWKVECWGLVPLLMLLSLDVARASASECCQAHRKLAGWPGS